MPWKTKYYKATGEIIIYDKCIDDPKIHNSIDLNEFQKLYDYLFNNIDMSHESTFISKILCYMSH